MDLNKVPKITATNARDFFMDMSKNVKPEWLDGVDTNFHLDIDGEGGSGSGGQFSVIVKDNKLEVYECFEGTPKCVITAKEKNFLALLKGDINPMMAVFTGKLKISNTGEVMKYAKLFGIM